MDISEKLRICDLLPEEPPKGLLPWVQKNAVRELGGDYLIYHSEWVHAAPSMCDLWENRTSGKKVRGMVCTCTACSDEFVTGGENGTVYLAEGEDGQVYPTDPQTLDNAGPAWGGIIQCAPPDVVCCPICGEKVQLIRKREIRGGRRKRILVAALQRVKEYAVIMYWMITREIWEEGGSSVEVTPWDAYVIGKRGGLTRFSHVEHKGFGSCAQLRYWRPAPPANAEEIRYFDWGSINSKKVGAMCYPAPESMIGTNAEKTGLYEYIAAGWEHPMDYLHLWRNFHGVENLVKAGWHKLIAQALTEYGNPEERLRQAVDFGQKKPAAMLGMTRAEFRAATASGEWSLEALRDWRVLQNRLGKQEAMEYLKFRGKFRGYTAEAIQIAPETGGLAKLWAYIEKQGGRPADVGALRDTWQAFEIVTGRKPQTAEEIWPKKLHATHDRLMEQKAAIMSKSKKEALQAGFDAVMAKYSGVMWSDGHLCTVIPASNDDLIREGDVLRHCVGGYGEDHATEKSLIFFIRHARRPERPYYTLNIKFDRVAGVRRVQLHGYGNERHGDRKQYSHKIPREVTEFCDRWEREILAPWYWANQKAKGETA